jgi:taurine dioxygenase
MQVENHPGAVGAVVRGLDLAQPLDEQTFARVRALILDRAVVCFAGQDRLTEAGQIAFSRRFGDLVPSELDNVAPPGFPEIFIVSNAIRDGKPIGAREVGRHWHTDFQHLKAAAALTMLHARKIPPEKGDTEFADMRAAYDALPEATKARIEGLEVLHSRVKAWPVMFPDRPPLTPEKAARTPDVVHPLVRIHPETGRRSLYVTANKAAWEILGMPRDEGQALLRELLEWATQPRFCFTHVWSDHDYLVWENRCLLHRATPFDSERYERIMYRTTIAGDPTFGPPRRAAAGVAA